MNAVSADLARTSQCRNADARYNDYASTRHLQCTGGATCTGIFETHFFLVAIAPPRALHEKKLKVIPDRTEIKVVDLSRRSTLVGAKMFISTPADENRVLHSQTCL